VVIIRRRTFDNAQNLSNDALEELLEQYDGTRLGLHELNAELLTDVEGALWRTEWNEAGRGNGDDVPELGRTVVSVDSADTLLETFDRTGIVAAGRRIDGDHYIWQITVCRSPGWRRTTALAVLPARRCRPRHLRGLVRVDARHPRRYVGGDAGRRAPAGR
jgi:phage terminase large subunit-like protein